MMIFFSELEHTIYICKILPYYVKGKIKYGIKINHVRGKAYYDCFWLHENISTKLFFDNLRDAQNQCIKLIINIRENG